MDKREQMQTLAAEADYFQRQLQDLQSQAQTLQMTEIEIDRTAEALKNLIEKKTSMFNLGSGVFVRADLREVNKLLVNVGASVLVEKDVPSSISFLEERKKEISEVRGELLKGMQSVSTRLREIDTEARFLMGEEGR
jgi:prefoldin alpha subunit